MATNNVGSKPGYQRADVWLIGFLGVYCMLLVVVPIQLILSRAGAVMTEGKVLEADLVSLVVVMGVLGGALQVAAELFGDVGKRTFDRAWSLAFLLRPFEGAGVALVVYLAARGGVGFLDAGESDPNALGYLALAAVSGMFAHLAAKGLRKHFAKLVGVE